MFYLYLHASSKHLVFLNSASKEPTQQFPRTASSSPFCSQNRDFSSPPSSTFYPMAQQGQQTEQDVLAKGKASMANSKEDCIAKETPNAPSPVAEEEVEDIWEREAKKWRASMDADDGTWRTWPDDDSRLALCSFVVSSIEHGIEDALAIEKASDVEDDYDAADEEDVVTVKDDTDKIEAKIDFAEKLDADTTVVAEEVDAEKANAEENDADDADAKDPSTSSSPKP